MRKTTGILDRVFGVDRLVRLAPPFHPAYFLGFLLLLLPNTSLAQSSVNSGASWSQYKSQCGIPASTAYNTWDGICPNSTASGNGSTPSVPALNPQQQLGMQLGMIGANMVGQAIGQGLHDWLFGSPDTPPVTAPPDPAEEQRQLAAQQLNNSGLYLLKQKNYAGAITEFQKALAIIPNDSNTLHNLTLAKQKMKDAAVAGQTSGALGQFLGNAPASTGLFGFAQPTDSPLASPNSSALSLVNLDSDTRTSNCFPRCLNPGHLNHRLSCGKIRTRNCFLRCRSPGRLNRRLSYRKIRIWNSWVFPRRRADRILIMAISARQQPPGTVLITQQRISCQLQHRSNRHSIPILQLRMH